MITFMKKSPKLTREQEAFQRSIAKLCGKIGVKYDELPYPGRRKLPARLQELCTRLGVTRIIMGHSKQNLMQEILKGSIINGLMKKLTQTDLFLMADRAENEGERIMTLRQKGQNLPGEPVKTFSKQSASDIEQRKAKLQRGKFKVYIGAAPGVGKTYTMLRKGNLLLRM